MGRGNVAGRFLKRSTSRIGRFFPTKTDIRDIPFFIPQKMFKSFLALFTFFVSFPGSFVLFNTRELEMFVFVRVPNCSDDDLSESMLFLDL